MMEKAREFDNILDECLDRIMKGQDIDSILALYPEYATELKPLLITAVETKKAATIKPRPEFRQRAAYEFQSAIRDIPPAKARTPFRWQLRWMAPVALVIVLILGGGGTVLAAANSLPDSPLYKVKLATEAVQLAFANSDLAKAELYSRFANVRVREIVKMAEKGNTDQVEKVTERMNNQLFAMANLTSRGEKNTLAADSATLHTPAAMVPSPTKAAATTPPATTEPPTEQTFETQTPPPTTSVASPPEVITQEPGPDAGRSQTTSGGAGYNNGENGNNSTQNADRHEKLKNNLVKNTDKNLKALQDQLEKAPGPLKAAIQRAIDVLLGGYEENISNLER